MLNFDFIQNRLSTPTAVEVNFDFGTSSHSVLAGTSNIFTAIWADPTASRTTGKLYVTSYGNGAAFSILDLKLRLLYDRYTTSVKGRANEVLLQDDPKDIIIN